ncbi:MAG: hypothetical protein U0796_02585 [Gemmatales bacterium]
MNRWIFGCLATAFTSTSVLAQAPTWGNYNGNAQHTGLSTVPLVEMNQIKWSTPVDLNPQYSGNNLLIHYGSPLATAGNTIIVPVKTGATGGFQVEGRSGYDGALLWTQSTDYQLPPHDWTPSFSPTITPTNSLYYAGEAGTVFTRSNLNQPGTVSANRLAFYGNANYTASSVAERAKVQINTPITSDTAGNIYFGYQVTSNATLGSITLPAGGGIARIDSAGNGTFASVSSLAAAAGITDLTLSKIAHNAAPALSNDGSTVYVPLTTNAGTGFGSGYLMGINSTTLTAVSNVKLMDVNTTTNTARLPEAGSASVMVAPDGNVFYGVLENTTQYHSRGWMLQYSADLSQTKIPSRFGWDDTASIVPSGLVPSYSGPSSYLIMTKYNNYAGLGGDGINKLGLFDPNVSEADEIYGRQVMKLVMSVTGPTADPEYSDTHPGAVREWCINAAAVDPFNRAILVNSEDGKSYCWDLVNNILTDSITLTPGIGEAYTPTIIGPDGTGYAINNGTLFALSNVSVPEPSSLVLCFGGVLGLGLYGFHKRKAWRKDMAS